ISRSRPPTLAKQCGTADNRQLDLHSGAVQIQRPFIGTAQIRRRRPLLKMMKRRPMDRVRRPSAVRGDARRKLVDAAARRPNPLANSPPPGVNRFADPCWSTASFDLI